MALELTLDRFFMLRHTEAPGLIEWYEENETQLKWVCHMEALNEELTLWEIEYWEVFDNRFGGGFTGKRRTGLAETTPARREWLEDGNR